MHILPIYKPTTKPMELKNRKKRKAQKSAKIKQKH